MTKDQVVEKVYQETHDFIVWGNDWEKYKLNGQYVLYGLLNAVFEVAFKLAPSKESVVEIVNMSLANFLIDKEDWNDKF